MIRNYLLLFFRNLRRQKLFSLINLLGLTVSIVCTLVIYLYVRNEFSYDRFHHHAERIYRVNQTFIWGEASENQFASTGPGVATALHAELPEVELMTSLHTPGNFIVTFTNARKEVISFEETKVLAADTNFFRMFNFPLLKGNPNTSLRQSQTIVMTESTARKYFGQEDPIGKMVRLGNPAAKDEMKTFEVTGVVKDLPDNSYIEFDMLLSMNSFPRVSKLNWSWVWTQLETFVRLDEHADINKTRERLALIPKKYAEETLQRAMNTSYDEYIKSGKKWELFLQPMTSIHLPSALVYNRLNDSGDLKIIYSLIGAGIFIVLLSCVNFMNLSLAQFTRRIKEASVRKILGLGRKELGFSYFTEALLFCLFALVVGLALTQLLLPSFNVLTGKALQLNLLHDTNLIFAAVGLILFMALLSSSYPALHLSGFQPVEAMKGKLRKGREGKSFRNSLVVFQFAVSVVLIVCTGVVFQQLQYVSKKNIGFEKENLIVLKHVEGIRDMESFANASLNVPGIVNATRCSSVPPNIWGGDNFSAEGMNDKTFPLNYTMADERYIPTLGIRMRLGRNFSLNTPGDVDRVILNEAALQKIGWKADESVIGKNLEYQGQRYEVAGVLSDFNYWSLATPIEPMAIFHIKGKMRDSDRQFLAVRLSGESGAIFPETIERLQQLWKVHAGDTPFQYEFVDQAFAETFKTQQQIGNVLVVLATLAILIACLGLLGMIIYSLEQRSKEIGIRKVSGASVLNILMLISGGYTKLIAIAFVIGAPVAWFLMDRWLQDFAYRVKPSITLFVLAGVGTLTIAAIITSYHAIKAALTNPVEVLRDE